MTTTTPALDAATSNMRRRHKAKKRLSFASIGLVLVGGLFVLAYPLVAVDQHREASSIVIKKAAGASSVQGNFTDEIPEDDDNIIGTLREVVNKTTKAHKEAVVLAKLKRTKDKKMTMGRHKRRKNKKKDEKVSSKEKKMTMGTRKRRKGKKKLEKMNTKESKTAMGMKRRHKKKKRTKNIKHKVSKVKLQGKKKKKKNKHKHHSKPHVVVDLPTTYASYVNVSLPFEPKNVKYIRSRHDRAGSVIWDMLKAQAYLFSRGDKFGGSCGYNHWHVEVEGLLRTVGLQHVLGYNCPPGMDEFNKQEKKHFVKIAKYRHNEQRTFTPEWMEYMKQVVPHPASNQSSTNQDKKVLTVAMHIRRGDVSLCTDNAKRRYLPNSYYLRLMDRLVEQHPNRIINVTIYSESPLHYNTAKGTQYEDWSVFLDRNYTLNLDGNIQQVWREFIDADILITSMSGFSLTPALLRMDRPGVIFTPHQGAYMLPHWELVPETDMQRMAAEMREMQIERCPLKGQEVDFFDDPAHDYERHYYINAA